MDMGPMAARPLGPPITDKNIYSDARPCAVDVRPGPGRRSQLFHQRVVTTGSHARCGVLATRNVHS